VNRGGNEPTIVMDREINSRDTTDIDAPGLFYTHPKFVSRIARSVLSIDSVRIEILPTFSWRWMMSFRPPFFSWPPRICPRFVAIRQRMRREQATRRPSVKREGFTAAHKSFFPSSPFFDSPEVNALPALARGGIHVYLFSFFRFLVGLEIPSSHGLIFHADGVFFFHFIFFETCCCLSTGCRQE